MDERQISTDEADASVHINPNAPSIIFTEQLENITGSSSMFSNKQKLAMLFTGVFVIFTIAELISLPIIFNESSFNSTTFPRMIETALKIK